MSAQVSSNTSIAKNSVMLYVRTFFIMVMFFCIITFAVAAFIKIDPEFGKKKTSDNG